MRFGVMAAAAACVMAVPASAQVYRSATITFDGPSGLPGDPGCRYPCAYEPTRVEQIITLPSSAYGAGASGNVGVDDSFQIVRRRNNSGFYLTGVTIRPLDDTLPATGIFATSLTFDDTPNFTRKVGTVAGGEFTRLNFFGLGLNIFDAIRINAYGDDPNGPATAPRFYFDNITLTYQGVPEPATWALMIVGFGAVGGAMRTRRRQDLATQG